MKLMPYIKKGIRIFIKDIRMMAISFLILPMALAFIYGNMQRDMFEGKSPSIEAVKVNFEYNEENEKGRILSRILSQEGVKRFILLDREAAEYTVIIQDDFKNAEIKGKDEGTIQFEMLNNFLKTLLNNFNKFELMQDSIGGLNIDESQRAELMNEIINSLNQGNNEASIREKIVEGYRTLGPIEYYTISMFSFTSLLMIATLAGNFYKEIKEGIVKRSLSTPNNRRNYFIGNMTSVFIISLIITVLYIAINRIRGTAFLGNPLHIGAVILSQCILCAAVTGFVTAFIKKEMTASILLNAIFILPSIFGGVFFYDEIIDNKIMKVIMNFSPNSLVLNSYKNLSITGDFSAITGEVLIMIILSIILLTAALIKIERKWEV